VQHAVAGLGHLRQRTAWCVVDVITPCIQDRSTEA
jgi:hypothetical protein